MQRYLLAAGLALSVCASASSDGRIIITEIMYNPASDEPNGEPEWVEIANVGDAAVDLVDWKLDDEDARTIDDWGTFSCTLLPGGVAVLVHAAVTPEEFREAWGLSEKSVGDTPVPQIIPIKWGGLSNSPSKTNENLHLVDSSARVICDVMLCNGGDWPTIPAAGGPSVYLENLNASDLNDGRQWKRSEAGVSGAGICATTKLFNRKDVGSPGAVPAMTPPAAQTSAPASTPKTTSTKTTAAKEA